MTSPLEQPGGEAALKAAEDMLKRLDEQGVPLAAALHALAGIIVGMCITATPTRAESLKLFDRWATACRRRVEDYSRERPDLHGAGWRWKQ